MITRSKTFGSSELQRFWFHKKKEKKECLSRHRHYTAVETIGGFHCHAIKLTNWRQFFMRLSCYWSWISSLHCQSSCGSTRRYSTRCQLPLDPSNRSLFTGYVTGVLLMSRTMKIRKLKLFYCQKNAWYQAKELWRDIFLSNLSLNEVKNSVGLPILNFTIWWRHVKTKNNNKVALCHSLFTHTWLMTMG